jgi:hypothetical protein
LYEGSGHDLLVVRDGLGHRSVAVTQRYLPVRRAAVDALILKSDWTRRSPARKPIFPPKVSSRPGGVSPRPKAAEVTVAPFLPGLEGFGA